MVTWQQEYLRRFYGHPGWVDGTTEFKGFVGRHASGARKVLELGCGPSNPFSRYLASSFEEVHGLDIDDAAMANDAMREVRTYGGSTFPYPDDSYDAVVSNYVLEHIEHPDLVLREVRRVLRRDGLLLFRTPNKWHYVGLVARATPHWFHSLVANRIRGRSSEDGDVCPTFHRLNSRKELEEALTANGYRVIEFRFIEKEPSYGMASRLMFMAFMGYERAVNATDMLVALRANILGAVRVEK